MSANTWLIIATVGFSLAGVALIVAIFIFIKLNIPSVIGDLTGKTVAREIKAMKEFNNSSSYRKYRANDNLSNDRKAAANSLLQGNGNGKIIAEAHLSKRLDIDNNAVNVQNNNYQQVDNYNEQLTYNSEIKTEVINNETEVMDAERTELLRDNSTEVLNDESTEMLRENPTELLKSNATEVLNDESTEVLGENPTELLKSNATEVLNDGSTEVLRENPTELLKSNATEVLNDESTEVLREKPTELLKSNATEVLNDGSTEVLRENPTELLKNNATQVLSCNNIQENYTTVLKNEKGKGANTPQLVNFRVTRSKILIHTDEVI